MKINKSPNWNMLIEKGQIYLTKGGDETYLFDDIDQEDAKLLFEIYNEDKFNNLDNIKNSKVLESINKLEKAGVIYKSLEKKKKITISLKWYSNINNNILSLLRHYLINDENIKISESIDESDLVLIIRNNSPFKDLLLDYEKLKIPHIFIDISFDHTISIGPIVFPGYTACLGCFIGRITYNWGDIIPPSIPNITNSYELISSIIFEYIKVFYNTGTCTDIINQVWSFNLKDFTTQYDKIYRLPWCPICFPEKLVDDQTGSFELPWSISKNQL